MGIVIKNQMQFKTTGDSTSIPIVNDAKFFSTEIEIALFSLTSVEEFRVNGPFFYAITPRDKNVVLLNGHINDFEATA